MGRYDLLQRSRGLGKRFPDPTPAYSDSLKPIRAKVRKLLGRVGGNERE